MIAPGSIVVVRSPEYDDLRDVFKNVFLHVEPSYVSYINCEVDDGSVCFVVAKVTVKNTNDLSPDLVWMLLLTNSGELGWLARDVLVEE